MVNLDVCNAFDRSSRIYVPNKTENINLNVFNIITKINESKIFTKHHANVNDNLTVKNVIQMKIEIKINVDEGAKMVNIQKLLLVIQ